MNSDATEDEIIARDQQANPDCNYSVNFSQVCSSQNGEMVCETIRNLQRYCPGKRPVTIYSKKDQYKGQSENMEEHSQAFPGIRSFEYRSGGSSSGNGSPDGFNGLFDSFRAMDQMLGGIAGEMFGRFAEDIQKEIFAQFPPPRQSEIPQVPSLPPHKLPPHLSQQPQQEQQSPPSVFSPWGGLWGSNPTRKGPSPGGDDSNPPKPVIPGRVTGPVEEI